MRSCVSTPGCLARFPAMRGRVSMPLPSRKRHRSRLERGASGRTERGKPCHTGVAHGSTLTPWSQSGYRRKVASASRPKFRRRCSMKPSVLWSWAIPNAPWTSVGRTFIPQVGKRKRSHSSAPGAQPWFLQSRRSPASEGEGHTTMPPSIVLRRWEKKKEKAPARPKVPTCCPRQVEPSASQQSSSRGTACSRHSPVRASMSPTLPRTWTANTAAVRRESLASRSCRSICSV